MSNASKESRLVSIAPAVGDKASSVPSTEALMTYTCVTCARRKVKCDKVYPACSTCRRSGSQCIYQAPEPRRRKRKAINDILDRLDRYEQLLRQNGFLSTAEVRPTSDATDLPRKQVSVPDRVDEEDSNDKIGKLSTRGGKTRYINGTVWRSLHEDDLDPSSEEGEDDDEADDGLASRPAQCLPYDPISSVLLGHGSAGVSLIGSHPTYEAAIKLWNIYVDNVDAVCKVLHVPSTEKLLLRVASNPSSATKSVEAVLFALYNIAIESLTDDQCKATFAQSRSVLQTRYRAATVQALVNAQFLKTTNLSVVQAYVLFLLSVRTTYDPHTFWILTGVLTRLGMRLGLHKSALDRGLNPFDVQIRRRVFWQLLPLDGMASQVAGTAIAINQDSWDVEQPLNINDVDIWPGMSHEPTAHEGATDMTFCLARTELGKSLKRAEPKKLDWVRLFDAEDFERNWKLINDFEESIETKYLRFCDISVPSHCLTMVMVRMAGYMGRFKVLLPLVQKEDASMEYRDQQWAIATKCLQVNATAYSNPLLRRYDWHLRAFFQWDPMIWTLNELRRYPARYNSNQIWTTIEATYENQPEILSMRRALQVAIARLTIKAWDVCRAADQAARPGTDIGPEPAFVNTIRTALHKRNTRNQRSNSGSIPYDPLHDNPNPQQLANMDLTNQVFSGEPAALAQYETPSFNSSGMLDFNIDSTDWNFFDQLIHGGAFDMPS